MTTEVPLETGRKRSAITSRVRLVSPKDWFGVSLLFLVFFLAFRWAPHLWVVQKTLGIPSWDTFMRFQADSDALVVNRLMQNRVGGIWSQQGFLMFSQHGDGAYLSQSGFGGWLLALFPTVVGAQGAAGIAVMYSIVAAFNALLASLAVRAMARTLSIGAALVTTFALLQPGPIFLGRSIYWMIGLKVVPAAALILLFSWGKFTRGRSVLVTWLLSWLAFSSGYEFLTVVVAAQLAVVGYYAIQLRWQIGESLKSVATTLIGTGAGFVTAVAVHLAQLFLRLGDKTSALAALEETVSKRTGATGIVVDSVYLQSLAATPGQVLGIYLDMPVIGAPGTLPILHFFTVGVLLFVCGTLVVVDYQSAKAGLPSLRWRAMGVSWFVALLGPLGWFLLARPHSFIHPHINFALWFLPTIPMGLALIYGPATRGLIGVWKQPLVAAAIFGSLVALAAFFLISTATVR